MNTLQKDVILVWTLDFGIGSAMLYCLNYRNSAHLSSESSMFAPLKSMEQECVLNAVLQQTAPLQQHSILEADTILM